jgi:hypothetical protein
MIYHIGEFLLPGMAFLLQDWRWLYVAVSVCCCLSALLVLPLPESPRWLLLHGRWQEAEAALTWLAALNGRQLPAGLVTPELVVDDEQAAGTVGVSHATAKDNHSTAADVFAAASSDAIVAISGHVDDESAGCDAQQELDEVIALLHTGRSPGIASPASCQQQQRQQSQGQHRKAGASSVLLLFTHPQLRQYFAVTAFVCGVCATSFYGLALSADNLAGSVYVNFLVMSLGEAEALYLQQTQQNSACCM